MNEKIISIRELAYDLNMNPLAPVNFNEFCSKYDIRIKNEYIGTDSIGNEILGACISRGLKKLVITSPNIPNNHRKRFTIAHEIGHLYLHHGNLECVATDFELSSDIQLVENDANTFAAELLLPYRQCLEAIRRKDVSFSIVETLAQQYEVSLSATAIRLVKMDSDMSAVIAHNGNKIQWIVKSAECRGDFIKAMTGLSPCTVKAKNSTKAIKETVDAGIWFEDDGERWICDEETRYFKSINSFLTIINTYKEQ